MVARRFPKAKVAGSIPVGGTFFIVSIYFQLVILRGSQEKGRYADIIRYSYRMRIKC